MYIYKKPIRLDAPVKFPYTFKDQTGTVIDLTNYLTVKMHVKLKGEAYAAIDGEFVSPLTSGQVRLENNGSYVFDTIGEWMVQWVATGTGAEILFGEPAKFTVVKNVRDADQNEVLEY